MSNSKYLQQTRSIKLSPRRSGFSLIEVVIALGVFVFGALAIVRIFPGALGVIQNSEQRATAQRMAQTTLAGYTNRPLTVPEAVIDVHPNLYNAADNETGWSDVPSAVFGSGTRNDSLPREPSSIDDISPDNSQSITSAIAATAAGRFRRIVGEEHVVKAEGSGLTATGVIELRHPFINLTGTGGASATHGLRLCETVTINDVTVSDDGVLDFTNATFADNGQPANDSTNPDRPATSLRVVAGADRQEATFYVSYRWRSGTGSLETVVDEPKRFPDNSSYTMGSSDPNQVLVEGLETDGAPGFANISVAPGPVQVKVRRRAQGLPLITSTPLDFGLGRVTFGAATATESAIGRRISVDYTVPDWRMIVHDDNLSTKVSQDDAEFLRELGYAVAPDASPTVADARQSVVPTRFLLDLPTSATPATAPSQVYAIVKGTRGGAVVTSSAQWSPDKFPAAPANIDRGGATVAASDPRPLAARPKTGQLFFDVGTGANQLAAPSARVVFRNLDGWLQQPAVAARSYVSFVDRTPLGSDGPLLWPRERWREYFYGLTATSTPALVAQSKAIVLHASEAGNTFLVTYTISIGGITRTMTDVPVTAESEVTDVSGLVPADFLGKYQDGTTPKNNTLGALLYLPDANGYKIGLNPGNEGGSSVTQHVTSILSLRGSSVRVRSAWFDGSRYSQAAVTGYRSLDVESASRP